MLHLQHMFLIIQRHSVKKVWFTMALTSVHPTVSFPVLATVGRFFAAIGNGLVSMGENSSRYRQVEALQALSDAELAKRGIERQNIVRVVYADAYWM
jgi:uncharacterized protein YjiS (DUF1127 family)